MDNKVIDKLYILIKNGILLEDLINTLGITPEETIGIIEYANLIGKKVEIIDTDAGKKVVRRHVKKVSKDIKPQIEECKNIKILAVSDTHFGNNRQQLHLLNQLYEEAYNRGITNALHVGDLVDGDYRAIRKEQERQMFLKGFNEQGGYVVDMYPKIKGMKTSFILGSHDETHFKNGQASIEYWLPKCREDMIFLGQDEGSITFDKLRINLDHPGDGSAKFLSYKPQSRIEQLESGIKPHILLIGHYHKAYQFMYRNVICVEVPCLCDRTPFQIKKGISNIVGGYFLDIYYDKKGNIQYANIEPKLFDKKDMWDEAGKDSRKVKQLVIN